MERLVGSAGFPWWWHTREDTIDKIDADVLALDTKVYLTAALRGLNAPLLPLDHGRAAKSLLAELESLQAAAGGRFDLAPALVAAREVVARLERVTAALGRIEPAATPAAALEAINRGLMRLSRILVPLAYTSGDRFVHDLLLRGHRAGCTRRSPSRDARPARALPTHGHTGIRAGSRHDRT